MSVNTESEPTIVKSVREGWHAPGYRDPQLHLVTDQGEIHIRLQPQAFVELHNILCEQQDCIDANGHAALDIEYYPHHTRHVALVRRTTPEAGR